MAQQFTLKRLMIAVTLIAVSLAMMRQIWCSPSNWTGLQALIASGCIGAPVDLLFRRRPVSREPEERARLAKAMLLGQRPAEILRMLLIDENGVNFKLGPGPSWAQPSTILERMTSAWLFGPYVVAIPRRRVGACRFPCPLFYPAAYENARLESRSTGRTLRR